MGKSMVSEGNFQKNATSIGWHLWGIDIRFAPELPSGWYPQRRRAPPGAAPAHVGGSFRLHLHLRHFDQYLTSLPAQFDWYLTSFACSV